MAEKAKITKSTFKKEWSGNGSITYYHDLELEGREGQWNIGATKKEPDFLAVGQELNFEVTDASKKKIKRVKDESAPKFGVGGGFAKSTFVPPDTLGITIGNAMTNVTTLVVAGKVDIKDFEVMAKRFAEVALRIKEELKQK